MIEAVLCECGCGMRAPIAAMTSKKHGWIKGRPKRFVHGHSGRRLTTEHVLSDIDIDKLVAVCAKCGPTKVYRRKSAYICGYHDNEVSRKKYAKDPKTAREKQRKGRLRVLFNLTPEEWDHILEYQGNVCAISGKSAATNRLSTDHNHATGLVRGLLSIRINRGLAYFNDDPVLLRKAADYLENPPAVAALGREVYGLIGQARHKKKMVYGSPTGPIKPSKKASR